MLAVMARFRKFWGVVRIRMSERGRDHDHDHGKPDKPSPSSPLDVVNNRLLKDIQFNLDRLDKKLDRDLNLVNEKLNVILVKLEQLEDQDKPPQAKTMTLDLGEPSDKS